jgi:hypothetical protein
MSVATATDEKKIQKILTPGFVLEAFCRPGLQLIIFYMLTIAETVPKTQLCFYQVITNCYACIHLICFLLNQNS